LIHGYAVISLSVRPSVSIKPAVNLEIAKNNMGGKKRIVAGKSSDVSRFNPRRDSDHMKDTEIAQKSAQKAPQHAPQSFESLHLSQGVLDFVKSENFTRMTPVQSATIPLFRRKDVAVQAVTGSGTYSS
jgi:hypothetical protein